MHVTQYLSNRVPPPKRKPQTPSEGLSKAEVQKRYRANVQRRLRALEAIEQIISDLKASEE